MNSGSDLERLSRAVEFPDVADEPVVEEDCGAARIYNNFYDGPRGGHGASRALLHGDRHHSLFARMDRDLLREVLITILANGDGVVARKKEHFLRSLQFLEVAHVLAINPDAGSLFDFRFALELYFAHNVVAGEEMG
jgi:hypothetical protein